MVLRIASLILKFINLGLVIVAGGLWIIGEVNGRPKNRDEQTLIGGAIWSQIQIPIGLILSMLIDEEMYTFMHAYFLFSGFVVLGLNAAMLVRYFFQIIHCNNIFS